MCFLVVSLSSHSKIAPVFPESFTFSQALVKRDDVFLYTLHNDLLSDID